MSTSVASGGNPLLNTGGNPLTSQGYGSSNSISSSSNIMLIMLNSSSKKQKIINLEKPMHLGRAVDNTPTSSSAIHNSTDMIVSNSNPQFIYYNSKVVSRNHALLKYENGKVNILLLYLKIMYMFFLFP